MLRDSSTDSHTNMGAIFTQIQAKGNTVGYGNPGTEVNINSLPANPVSPPLGPEVEDKYIENYLNCQIIWKFDGANWVLVNISNVFSAIHVVTQTSHGYGPLPAMGAIPVYHDGTEWKLARANAKATLHTHCIVRIPDNDTLWLMTEGGLYVPAHGDAAPYQLWYLSETTAGQITKTAPPAPNYKDPVLQASGANNVTLFSRVKL